MMAMHLKQRRQHNQAVWHGLQRLAVGHRCEGALKRPHSSSGSSKSCATAAAYLRAATTLPPLPVQLQLQVAATLAEHLSRRMPMGQTKRRLTATKAVMMMRRTTRSYRLQL